MACLFFAALSHYPLTLAGSQSHHSAHMLKSNSAAGSAKASAAYKQACCLQRAAVVAHNVSASLDIALVVQKEVTSVLLEGDKGGQQLDGVAMKGTIARRFEELDWDNNGTSFFVGLPAV